MSEKLPHDNQGEGFKHPEAVWELPNLDEGEGLSDEAIDRVIAIAKAAEIDSRAVEDYIANSQTEGKLTSLELDYSEAHEGSSDFDDHGLSGLN